MAEGEIGAAFENLSHDAAEAGADIAESVANLTEKTADIEAANLDRTLAQDGKAAENLEAAGRGSKNSSPSGSAVPGMDQPADVVADKIALHAAQRSIPGVPDDELPEYLESVMSNPGTPLRSTPSGIPRMAWWDERTGTMIIREGNDGTFMQPDRGYDYFLEQVRQ
jgi:hypothetical protein